MSLFLFPKRGVVEVREESDDVVFFDDGVPNFVEGTLESLYQCLMSTLLRIRQYYPIETAKTYVAYRDGNVVAALLFRVEREKIVVYNEQIHIPQSELVRFVRNAFKRYAGVRKLSLYAIDIDEERLPFSHQRLDCLEDIRMELPQSSADYLASLGKNTAETIRRSEKKLRREHPSFQMRFYSREEVKVEDVEKIMDLSRRRIEAKGQTCYHTAESNSKLVELVKRYGLVGVAFVDDEVRGGIIMLQVGSHWFAHTIAHDPDFDTYRLGHLCNYYGVIETINQGGGIFHFGWGRSDHKYRLGASHRELFRLDIYRNPVALIIDIPQVAVRSFTSCRRRLKLWIAQHDRVACLPVARVANWLRPVRSVRTHVLRRLRSE
ncbi:MAG: GNAT family N-acetyltransferase [Halobacteriota archaeon]